MLQYDVIWAKSARELKTKLQRIADHTLLGIAWFHNIHLALIVYCPKRDGKTQVIRLDIYGFVSACDAHRVLEALASFEEEG